MKLWKRKSDLLVEETLAFVQGVARAESHRDVTPMSAKPVKSVIQSDLPKPKDRLFEDEEMQKRLSEFTAVQHKFAREREEFFRKTMSRARSSLARDDV